MKKYSVQDHHALADWAADCAERVLNFFEEACPGDDRPRRAIETCRAWARTGVFRMTEIRGASLAAHAAARSAKENKAACFAARAAGQAVATAHVPQHAYGAAYYALKTIDSANRDSVEAKVIIERKWQARRLPANLRKEVMGRIAVVNRKKGLFISVEKDADF